MGLLVGGSEGSWHGAVDRQAARVEERGGITLTERQRSRECEDAMMRFALGEERSCISEPDCVESITIRAGSPRSLRNQARRTP